MIEPLLLMQAIRVLARSTAVFTRNCSHSLRNVPLTHVSRAHRKVPARSTTSCSLPASTDAHNDGHTVFRDPVTVGISSRNRCAATFTSTISAAVKVREFVILKASTGCRIAPCLFSVLCDASSIGREDFSSNSATLRIVCRSGGYSGTTGFGSYQGSGLRRGLGSTGKKYVVCFS